MILMSILPSGLGFDFDFALGFDGFFGTFGFDCGQIWSSFRFGFGFGLGGVYQAQLLSPYSIT